MKQSDAGFPLGKKKSHRSRDPQKTFAYQGANELIIKDRALPEINGEGSLGDRERRKMNE
jgi:hypothetical protein